ncbi:ABC transporter permease [Halomonas sp. 328]|uniref:ABC transporter permease n=1 Tax=Halomonas sp. 328 TaxID=2776704 RepID=UPI0018A72249|nr:ABC transporter permease [Halomonas sp. 328]MBF8223797.1 ABC transporter permease [Halomonas sp. 328]
MTSMRALWQAYAAVWKEIRADKGALMLLFVAGVVYSLFYPLPYRYEQVESVPVAVVDRDLSPSSRTLVRWLESVPALEVERLGRDPAALQEALWRGEVMGLVVIPEGFHGELLAGRQADLQVASHEGYLLAGSKVLAGVSQAAATLGAGVTRQRLLGQGQASWQAEAGHTPVRLEARALYNADEGYGSYVVPAVMVLIIQQTLLMGITLIIGSRAERGRLGQSPIGYAGMLAAFTTVGVINCLYYFEGVTRFQDYPLAGTFGPTLLFSVVFSLCVSALALLLASAFDTRERGLQLLLATSIPMLFLAGYSWPVEALPEPLVWLRWLLPSTAGIQGLVALNQMGVGLEQVSRELGVLLALTLVAVPLGAWRYARLSGGPKAAAVSGA